MCLGKPSSLYDSLNPDWVPNQKMGYVHNSFIHDEGRYNRLVNRRLRQQLIPKKQRVTDSDENKCALDNEQDISCGEQHDIDDDEQDDFDDELDNFDER